MSEKGYRVKEHGCSTKRYCQTLELKDVPELIQEYIMFHSQAYAWPEIREGIRSVGILEMEIYISGNRLFMIVETPLDFDWDKAMAELATLHVQKECAPYVIYNQSVKPGITSWGQVKYAYASNVNEMVKRLRYDILYLENRSLGLDLKILLLTVKIVFL